MTHAAARRRRAAGDEARHGLLEVVFDPGRGRLFGVAADFADEDDELMALSEYEE